MRKCTLFFLLLLLGIVNSATLPAFQITLPKGYLEKLEKKRNQDASALWKELARDEIEAAIRQYVATNPHLDNVDIRAAADDLAWKREGTREINAGAWKISLSEWEYHYPSLKKTKWDTAKLVASLSYDYQTKQLNGRKEDGEIRLYFKLRREGGWFSRRKIHVGYETADYGEVVYFFPFGGVELRKNSVSNN